MSGAIFQRGETWYYRIPAKTPDGRYVTIWKGDPTWTKDMALREKRKAEVKRDERGQVATSKLTVGGWVERWLSDRQPELKPSTFKDYSSLLRDYVIYDGRDSRGQLITTTIGKTKLKDLKRRQLYDLYVRLQKRGIHRTALKVHNVLRACLKDAVMLEVLDRNPSDGLPAPKVTKTEPTMPANEDLKRLLDLGEGTTIGVIVNLVIWTGLRESEIAALEWKDLDLGRRLLHVKEAKHNSVGTIALSSDTVTKLVKHRLAQREEATLLGPAWRESGAVFTNELGEALTSHAIRGRWGRLRARAGIKLPFHGLRHVHASLLIQAGMHPKMIQARMRHKDFSTTMNVYGHWIADVESMDPHLQELDALLARDS
jgi:integrase